MSGKEENVTECFYVLLHDASRDDLETVEDYEMADFDETALWNGKKLKGPIPASVRLFVSDGLPSDLLGNPLSWLLLSPRFVRIIEPFVSDSVQFMPITLLRTGTLEPIRRYVLANPIGCVDAIAGKRGKGDTTLSELVLKKKSIPPGKHFFRLRHQETRIVFSQEVFEALKNQGLQGVAAKRIRTE